LGIIESYLEKLEIKVCDGPPCAVKETGVTKWLPLFSFFKGATEEICHHDNT